MITNLRDKQHGLDLESSKVLVKSFDFKPKIKNKMKQ